MRRLCCSVLAIALLGGTESRCPSDMVPLRGRVCIDRYEWPNLPGERPLIAASAIAKAEDLKSGIVMDGERLCLSVGKRLCYEDEWVDGCLGPGGAKFPFGAELPDFVPGENTGLCNYDKRFRLVDERKVELRDPGELDRLDQSEPAGSRPDCVSAAGAYDMMGSVEEWVRTRDGSYALAGRYWAEAWACYSVSRAHAPNWHYYESGFRCCKGDDR